ncbi:MAG: HAD-IB family phosphatase [Calditrichae bacterium]|nr:HAD-IB family phosphatase [Calditrichia bacterium]
MAQWAVFDVDGTLFPASSMEKSFIGFMIGKGAIPAQNIFTYFFIGLLKSLLEGYEEGFKNNKYYLKYLPVQPVLKTAAKFVRRQIWPQISTTGLQRIAEYRSKNYRILIMSGSPDILTYPLAEMIQPDFTIAADLEIRDQQFTGKLKNPHPYGKRKSQLLVEHQSELQIQFDESVVFANHHADYHHMALFGKAIAVNPTPKLKLLARKHHWQTEVWK